jgi:hypothetical protein
MIRSQVVSVSGKAKMYLDALVALQQRGPASIVGDAILCLVHSLPTPDRDAVEAIASRALGRNIVLPQNQSEVKVAYKYSRLCFKRKVIDALAAEDEFRVETPGGAFQLSKADFETDFGQIAKTASWKKLGFYSYPVVPSKAEKYRISV